MEKMSERLLSYNLISDVAHIPRRRPAALTLYPGAMTSALKSPVDPNTTAPLAASVATSYKNHVNHEIILKEHQTERPIWALSSIYRYNRTYAENFFLL